MSFYRKTTLPSGLRVITEAIPHVRSVSVGVWVGAGSCFERPEEMGVSHLIEHMLFKGTRSRTAREIAREIDGRGGMLNAFTAKEHTCYYAKVLDEHLPIALDLLADMLLHSRFDPADLDREKSVILEEIKMYEDVPDDLVHDLFASTMWRDHALGRPIVGTAETVRDLSREAILSFMGRHYVPGNMVVAAAGHLEHEAVVERVAAAFGEVAGGPPGSVWPATPGEVERPRAVVRPKEIEQTHLVLGTRGLAQEDHQMYALHLLNTVLGGGASSRLFQEIREQRGMAYSVYSYHASFRTTGNFAVYAGVSPQMVAPVLELVVSLLEQVGRESITPDELAEAKEQLKGQIMLGLESTSSRMTRLGRGELSLGRVLSPDEIIQRIDGVTSVAVAGLARRLFLEETRVLSAVGPLPAEVNLSHFGFAEVQHG
ncbi:MAG: M16 family metallopeptidase [Bacillota bacterium]